MISVWGIVHKAELPVPRRLPSRALFNGKVHTVLHMQTPDHIRIMDSKGNQRSVHRDHLTFLPERKK